MNGTREKGLEKQEEIAMMPQNGWGSKRSNYEPDEEQMCGVGSCRPRMLRSCTGIWTFTIFYGLSSLFIGSLRVYLGSQLMGLERQFELSNTTTGIIVSCTDITFLVFVVMCSYPARRWHIPRVLAISTVICGAVAMICVLPHAITRNDLHPPPVVKENDSLTMEKLQLSAPSCMVGNLPPDFMESMMTKMASLGPMGPPAVVPVAPPASGRSNIGASADTHAVAPKVDTYEPTTQRPTTAKPTMEAPVVETQKPTTVPTTQKVTTTTTTTRAPPPTTKKTTAAPIVEGETYLMPNFTKLAQHPQYPTFVVMAKNFGIDLPAVAAMKFQDQVNYVINLPPHIKAMLPNLRLLLAPNPDDYFYPIILPKSRKKRDVSTDMMHSGMLSMIMKNFLPLPDSLVNEMAEAMCPFNTGPFMKSSDSTTITIAVIMAAMLIQGIARAPRLALSTIYIDDNVEETRAGLPLGIILGLGSLGTAVAYGLGGLSSFTYVTLEDTGFMTVFNPRWLGAWWLGFLIYGVLILALALPIVLLPRYLPSTTTPYKEVKKRARTKMGKVAKESKGFIQSMLRLFRNPVYVLLTLANAVSVLATAGVVVFISKYIENQFSLPPFQAGIILLLVYVVGSSIGAVVGGIISTKARLSPLKCVTMVVIVSSILVVVHACAIGFGCDQPILDKGDKIIGNTSTEMCVDTCVCVKQMYAPVCGSDGNSYFSACHAGCGEAYDGKYHDCKCIDDKIKTAKPMMCEQPCNFLYAFCAIFVLGGFLLQLKAIPAFLATYRSVETKDAPLAIGVNSFISTLGGFIPSPIIFGAIADATCVFHRPKCGILDSCAHYDIVTFRLNFHGLSTGLMALATLIYVAALLIGRRSTSAFGLKVYDKGQQK